MSKFIKTGGKKLSGEIRVSGSKNAVLALMAASVLTDQKCVLTNVPQIKDVEVMISLITKLGVKVSVDKSGRTLSIDASTLKEFKVDSKLASKLRASIMLIAPLIARLKRAVLPSSGGDRIGVRTIEPHLKGLTDLGVAIKLTDGYEFEALNGLKGGRIVMEESSVTATENLLMAASMASGTTVIKLAAMEPHVQQLAEFLNKMGAKISGIGTPIYIVEGVSRLNGAQIEVIPDSNQAAAFISLAAATYSCLKVINLNPDFLDDFLLKMKQFGVNFKVGSDFVEVLPPNKPYQGIKKLQVGLYPKLASDDVPPMAVLATQAEGETVIYEWLYENRLSYAPELNKMGAQAEILDPHRVKIIGPSQLRGNKLSCTDIRMGMTLVIAALVASGESEIEGIEHVDRGYEDLEARLQALGADIKRID